MPLKYSLPLDFQLRIEISPVGEIGNSGKITVEWNVNQNYYDTPKRLELSVAIFCVRSIHFYCLRIKMSSNQITVDILESRYVALSQRHST